MACLQAVKQVDSWISRLSHDSILEDPRRGRLMVVRDKLIESRLFPTSEPKMKIDSGTRPNQYEIISRIGAGGMGEVYLAQDTKLDRRVALKILPADVASNHDRMEDE